jgi:hypothetical protein
MFDQVCLDDHELWTALQSCDPIAIAHRALGGGRIAENVAGAADDDSPVARDRPGLALSFTGEAVRVLPPSRLLTLWGATIAAAIAYRLMPPGVVTAGMLVDGVGGVEYLAMLTRAVPDLSHVALFTRGVPGPALVSFVNAQGVRARHIHDPREAFLGSGIVIIHGRGWRTDYRSLLPRRIVVEVGDQHGPANPAGVFADRPLPGERDLAELLGRHAPGCAAATPISAGTPIVVRVREPSYGARELPECLYQAVRTGGLGNRGTNGIA